MRGSWAGSASLYPALRGIHLSAQLQHDLRGPVMMSASMCMKAWRARGRWEEAVGAYRSAARAAPEDGLLAYSDWGAALVTRGEIELRASTETDRDAAGPGADGGFGSLDAVGRCEDAGCGRGGYRKLVWSAGILTRCPWQRCPADCRVPDCGAARGCERAWRRRSGQ